MASDIAVRPATLADVPGIREVHASCDDPWGDIAQCAIWTNHRLVTGFLVDVASIGRKVVGHAEWILSDEPSPFGRHLYLGMIQVHDRYQRRGVGRQMLRAGVEHARALGCPVLRTHPDDEAMGFYRRCGFACAYRAVRFKVPPGQECLPPGWRRLRSVPRKVIGSLPMRSGWVQGSSAHMWELCNNTMKVHGEDIRHPCAGRVDGGGFVQLRFIDGLPESLCVSWARRRASFEPQVHAAMVLSEQLPTQKVTLVVLEREAAAVETCLGVKPGDPTEIWDCPVP